MIAKSLLLLSFLKLALTLPQHPAAGQPRWETLASLSVVAQEQSTVYLAPDTIAILGGIIPVTNSTLVIGTTPEMQFYSISNNSWTTRADIPIPLNHPNVAVVDGRIYLLGGLAEDENELGRTWQAVPDSSVYDPKTNKWTSIPGVPKGEERGSGGMGVYKNRIYVAGGMKNLDLYANGTQGTIASVIIFDTVTQTWLDVPKEAKQLPQGRDHAGAAVVGSKMYILGGRFRGRTNVQDDVFILDLDNLEAGWKTSEAKMPTARGGVASGAVGNKIYVFGGEGNPNSTTGIFPQVEGYDTVTDTWESLSDMKVPRHGTYGASAGGKIYIPGGGLQEDNGQDNHSTRDFDAFIP
jgi:N-acetylneuraminic acid mutarotase